MPIRVVRHPVYKESRVDPVLVDKKDYEHRQNFVSQMESMTAKDFKALGKRANSYYHKPKQGEDV